MTPFPDLDAPLSDGVVLLRRFTLDDVAEVTRALQDPEIIRWTASIPCPYTESEARSFIERHPGNWSSGTTAAFAIADATDRTLLGNINVIVPPDAPGTAAMMYWVAAWGRRRSVATRSLVLASDWAFGVLDCAELCLETLSGNIGSEGVAEKAGYSFAGYRSEDFTRPESPGRAQGTFRVKEWVIRRTSQLDSPSFRDGSGRMRTVQS